MKLFWTILKSFGITAGTFLTISGAVLFFDGMKDDIVDIKETQVEYQATADTILFIARTYDERIRRNDAANKSNEGQIGVLRDSYLEYLKNDSALTKDVFVEYMNPFLEYIKKNSGPTVQSTQTLSVEKNEWSTGGHTGVRWNSSH